ncbi:MULTISPECIES: ABC transporter permease [unclassified Herbaspirillum]|uniref:ABC transporter permease n=1 Tax=unclassified Herbaspirillum TaxID=2624150 RepID=UPI00114EDD63|nr:MULTISPECIES: ABC transporter permease [unclassified Herbaspirillum]MBB5393325.1 NitT/TauT family transport system permease protein [Herbaspirillum sp. SJZ102]TQK03926.1 NitT/TauT family transport system permease protein [Herbaspirillum sp. SJZ130]TQK08658.1 NitT/TauT family transport system permease protein [Herbaspirillum sp. SJZ106]TWC71929.1 NitT/TauT family transport system permease protein [Herbaspirillum sp. SJZ099]
MNNNTLPFVRPEIVVEPNRNASAEVQRPLSAFESLYRLGWLRKTAILLVLAAIWEIYGRWLDNALLFPSFSQTLEAFLHGIASGVLLERAAVSLQTLLVGYGLGILLAGLLTTLAISSRIGNDLLETLTSMFNPLPAIALLPLALIWFGLGTGSIIFVLVHSVLWAVALNTHGGFRAVSNTLRMVGQNYGLRRFSLVKSILIPAAFPSILTGLKVGWAFAWRTLIAAELVFGVSSGTGGLGWYIFENRNQLETANVFSGLFFVIIIGLVVENLIFAQIEKRTIRRWGMAH